MEPQPLADDDKAFFRSLMTAVVTNPGAYDTAAMILDVDAMLDATGLPKSEQVVDIADQPGVQPGAPGTPAPTVAASRWKSARFGSAVMGRSAAEMLRRAQNAATRFGEVRGTLGP